MAPGSPSLKDFFVDASKTATRLSRSKFSPPPRADTLTDYTEAWTSQYVLSLGKGPPKAFPICYFTDIVSDGGGIKGYSSLLILQRLMKHINEEEKRLGPDPPQVWYSEKLPQPQPPFELCYYLDYVFGTSTGG